MNEPSAYNGPSVSFSGFGAGEVPVAEVSCSRCGVVKRSTIDANAEEWLRRIFEGAAPCNCEAPPA
jgi:hypothetical protein